MSSWVYACLERRSEQGWELAQPLRPDPQFDGDLVPVNVAPESWGKGNFAHYYAISGERDLPVDLSEALRRFLDRHWEVVNRPSWMSLAEIAGHERADVNGVHAHLNAADLRTGDCADDQLRVVFWADQ